MFVVTLFAIILLLKIHFGNSHTITCREGVEIGRSTLSVNGVRG